MYSIVHLSLPKHLCETSNALRTCWSLPLLLLIPKSDPSFLLQKMYGTNQTQLWKEAKLAKTHEKNPWKQDWNADEKTRTVVEYYKRCEIIGVLYV